VRLALSILSLSACGQLPDNTRTVPTAELVQAWVDDGHSPGDCRARGPRVRAVLVQDTADLCYRPGVYGCYLGRDCVGLFGWGACYDVIVLRSDQPPGPLLRHELTHWLLDCSGEMPGGDYHHVHELWGTDGFGPVPVVDLR
jgi:hypothetical protein